MSKSKFREGLESLTPEQAARVIPEVKEWLTQVEAAKDTTDYSSMSHNELMQEAYRLEREARSK